MMSKGREVLTSLFSGHGLSNLGISPSGVMTDKPTVEQVNKINLHAFSHSYHN